MLRQPNRRGGTGMGVLIGIVSAGLVGLVLFVIAAWMMNQCPLCGNAMPLEESHMMQRE